MEDRAALTQFLHTLSVQELRIIQQAVNCRVYGKRSRRLDLLHAIEAHDQRYGFSRGQAKALLDHHELLYAGHNT